MPPTTTPVTLLTTRTQPDSLDRLRGAETRMLAALGGEPWQLDRLTPEAVADAKALWRRACQAVGYKGAGRWVTDETTNSKLGKGGIATRGVTLHPAAESKVALAELDLATQLAIAEAFGVELEVLGRAVGLTMCPKATKGCIKGCVASKSANGQMSDARKTRLLRTLLHLLRPDLAFALTGDSLRKMRTKHGDDCRWRVNIADDIRWERIAPGLFEIGVAAYSYTKFSPTQRRGFDGFRLVYSASEDTSDAQIHEMIRAGHNVAVVFDVKKSDLPSIWQGVEVVDGDATDDLHSHKAATIVGLAVKGPSLDIRSQAADVGFARAS